MTPGGARPYVPAAPAWLLSAAPAINEIVDIPNSIPSDYPPSRVTLGSNPLVTFETWSTFCRGPDDRLYGLANSGHSNGAVNALPMFDVWAATGWVYLYEGSADADVIVDVPVFADDRPSGGHGYWDGQFSVAQNRPLRIGATSVYGSAFSFGNVSGVSLLTGDYLPSSTYATALFGIGDYTPMCMDPVSEDVWTFHGADYVQLYRLSTNTWYLWYQFPGQFNASLGPVVFDGLRNRVFGVSLSGAFTMDPSPAPSSYPICTPVTITGASVGAVANGQGLVHDTDNDVYLLHTSAIGGPFYEINPTTFVASAVTTTGGGSIAALGHPVLGKLHYSAPLKGALFVGDYGDPVRFIRRA